MSIHEHESTPTVQPPENTVKERLFHGHAAVVFTDLDQCVGDSLSTFPHWHSNHHDTIRRLFKAGVKTVLVSNRGYDSISPLAESNQVTAFYPEAGAISAWKANKYRASYDQDPLLKYARERVLPNVDRHVYQAAAQLRLDSVLEKFKVDNYRCYYFDPDKARQQEIQIISSINDLRELSIEKLKQVLIDGSPVIDSVDPPNGHLIASHDSAFNLHPTRTKISKVRALQRFIREAAEFGLEIHGRPLIFIEDSSADWLEEAIKQFGSRAFFAIPANASAAVRDFAEQNKKSGHVFVSHQPYAQGVIDAYGQVLESIKFHQHSQNVFAATV